MKILFNLSALMLLSIISIGQNLDPRIIETEIPLDKISKFDLPRQDNRILQLEAESDRIKGTAPRFAKNLKVDITPKTHGNWEMINNDELLWRVVIESKDAKSINLGFTEYHMPDEGELIIYSDNKEMVQGPFTPLDNEDHNQLWTPIVFGDKIVVQVKIPEYAREKLSLNIGYVNHDFMGFGQIAEEKSGSCNVDVICGPTDGANLARIDNHRDIIRSVAVISLGGGTFCSGFLVNNTAQDQKPYFMTADHCGINAGNAASLVTYWLFENSTCRQPGSGASGAAGDGALSINNTGAIFRAGNAASDFTLVELDDPINSNAQAFFAGWRNDATIPTSVIAIHHPSTDEKRISFEDDPVMISNYLSSTPDPNGNEIWVNDWDLGTTEGGSSGSPLFDQNEFVVGQLHGGFAACGNNASDWYGWFHRSWSGAGSSATRLSNWLDPLNTGQSTLPGLETLGPPAIPIAAFTPNSGSESFCPDGAGNAQISFSDASMNLTTGWNWTFSGSANPTPTSSTAQNPVVSFTNTGTIIATLQSSNISGTSTNTAMGTINVMLYASCNMSCQTFSSGALGINIADNQTGAAYTNSINVTGLSGAITDVNITNLNVDHTYTGDLDITLTSPSGTDVIIVEDNCGNDENMDIGFNDEATGTIPCPMTGGGSFPPQGNLTDFDGESPNGSWTLEIIDDANVDGGTWNSWGIEICALEPVMSTCSIDNINISNIACDDNMTPSMSSDDTYTFDVAINATNGDPTGFAFGGGLSGTGTYGTTLSQGPFPISGGNISFTVSDNTDSSCTGSGLATAPATCSNAPDPCTTTLVLTGSENGVNDHEATWIESDQILLSTAKVDYDATDYILLKAGFQVDQGALFEAFIDGCNGGAGGVNLTSDVDNEKK